MIRSEYGLFSAQRPERPKSKLHDKQYKKYGARMAVGVSRLESHTREARGKSTAARRDPRHELSTPYISPSSVL
jgi:hypothetical protein